MSKFIVTYPSGLKEETIQSDCHSVEAFINTKFGSIAPYEYGITVEMDGDEDQLAQEQIHQED